MGKFLYRLQQPVPGPLALLLEHDQRLLDERSDQIEDILRRDRLRAADRLGCLQVETAGEDAQPVEDDLLVLLQQIVGPAHQRPQRLLALQCDATAAGEEFEAIVQSGVDVAYRQ